MKRIKMVCMRGVLIALMAALTNGAAAAEPSAWAAKKLLPIRVAVFDFEVLEGVEVKALALTDHINAVLGVLPKVTIVNRDQIEKVADEHKLVMTGLADLNSAVKLGKFLSAQQVVVGRAGLIGQKCYVVVKLVDVETTVQTTVSVSVSADDGVEKLLEHLGQSLATRVQKLQRPKTDARDAALAKLRKAVEPLAGKVVLVNVTEQHLDRPLKDPAAQMAACNRLRSLGFEAFAPTDPKIGWKQTLLKTGKYDNAKVDYLLEGEGVSAFVAEIQGFTSCRGRVELRLVAVPGRSVTISEKGLGANVDLAEAFAAKAALEAAGVNAVDAVVARLAERLAKQNAKKDTP
ncbi:MAG: hypothetical protein HQ567_25485 [Candidatus Nealsonbacteria bacterium]|nr:hypothetical protein [Candidatus Nealsonbacteria bacterium]